STDTSLVVRGGAVRSTTYGIDVENAASNKVNAIVVDTELTGDTFALFASNPVPGGSVRLVATRCTVSNSTTVFATSALPGQMVADGCTVSGNDPFFSAPAGMIYSRGNNTLFNNTTTGSFTPLAPQ